MAGFTVVEAASGAEALRLCEEEIPDVVLVDLMMPHMDGFDLSRKLRNLPEMRSTPIIMLTAKTGSAVEEQASAEGIAEVITKPFESEDLPPAVLRHLRPEEPSG